MIRLSFRQRSDLPLATAAVREALRRHGVVALPTETFYGLAVDPHDSQAVARVFSIKGRETGKALQVLGASVAALEELVVIREGQRALLEGEWPAPLTVVLPARQPMAGCSASLAVRVPAHPLLRALLARVGALTATSANRSGAPPLASAEGVMAALGGELELLLDGGTTPGGAPSTVLEWTSERPRLLRQGVWDAPPSWGVKVL